LLLPAKFLPNVVESLMEDHTEVVAALSPECAALVQRQRDRRKQLRELLRTQQTQLQRLETGLTRQRQQWQSQLTETSAANESRATIDPNLAATTLRDNEKFAEDAAALAQLSDQLDQRQAELMAFEKRLQHQERAIVDSLAEQQTQLDERAAELDASDQQLRQLQRTLAASEEELSIDRDQVAHLRERLHQELEAIEREREELSDRRADLQNQRRRIARQLQQQRKAQKHEIEKERETLDEQRQALEADRQRMRAERDQQIGELARQRTQLSEAVHAGDDALSKQLANSLEESSDLRGQLAEIRHTLNARGDELETLRGTQRRLSVELEEMRAERDQLLHQVDTTAKAQVTAKSKSNEAAGDPELKKRFELAMDDVRQLKRRNSELEEQLASARAGKAPVADSGGLDWESQKRRLLASLEADDSTDPKRQEEKLSIESTIQITDDIINRKDRELSELRRVLEEQSSNLGSVAVGAAALAEILDNDELIRQERENLKQLQVEWREKLKQAEIDISVERARMGRERLELEEKLRSLASEKAIMAEDAENRGPADQHNPAHRRWWNRLGLKDKDGDEG
jgi:chromosome segregation ATPase